jgi:hypothetical protein
MATATGSATPPAAADEGRRPGRAFTRATATWGGRSPPPCFVGEVAVKRTGHPRADPIPRLPSPFALCASGVSIHARPCISTSIVPMVQTSPGLMNGEAPAYRGELT